jgi:alcohol dehydrogenase class IV
MHRTAGLKYKLKGFGVNTKKKAFSAIKYVNIERLQNNPVIILEDDIKEILSSIL